VPLAPSKIRIPKIQIPQKNSLDELKYPFLFKDPLGNGPVKDGAFDPDRVQEVSLNECVLFALQNNPDIHVSQFAVPSAAEQIPLQESIFDPVFRLGGQWSRTDQQVLSVIEGNGIGSGGVVTDSFGPPQGLIEQLQLSKQFETGGFFEAGWETAYTFSEPAGNLLTLNPSQRSRMNFRLEQPLFRGAGEDANLAGIGVARANHRASLHDFEANVNQLIRDTQVGYWQVYHTKANVEANEDFVTEARVTWQKEITKRSLGASSLPQVAQAREQYERFRQELQRSRRRYLTAEQGLRQLLGMPGETDFRIIPDESPLQTFVEVDWQAGLSEALVNRPEIASQRESIRTAEINYEKATNGLCPDVTAFANYSLSGVGRDFSESANTVLDNRFQDWTLGFRYERAFGRRFDQATEQQSAILLMQERAQLRSIEHSVEHELRAAYNNLVTASDLVSTLNNQLAAAEVQVDANRVLFDSGRISLDLFLRTQTAYAETLRQKQQVFVEYTQALAEWDYARGTIMRSADVTMTEKLLPEPEWD
jgi:outer membrane protein TolC